MKNHYHTEFAGLEQNTGERALKADLLLSSVCQCQKGVVRKGLALDIEKSSNLHSFCS